MYILVYYNMYLYVMYKYVYIFIYIESVYQILKLSRDDKWFLIPFSFDC